MKKIVLLFITVFCMCCMVACGGEGGNNTSAGDNKEELGNSIDEPVVTTEEPASPTEEPTVTPEPAGVPDESVTEDEVIYVSTAGEFLEAIAPGVVIELAPGTYNLTEYLRKAPDNFSDYVARTFTDGWQAEIREVDGLTICGAMDGKVEIVAEPRYSDVLYFTDCSDIVIENITFGHTIELGNCQGAVLEFDYCQQVSLDGLDLYGCGTYGVVAVHTEDITLTNCIIRECSYGIVDLLCSGAVFADCIFKDNEGFDMLCLSDSFAHFQGCSFTGNEGDNLLPAYYHSDSESGALFEGCTFGRWESQRLNEELKDRENFVFGDDCQFDTEVYTPSENTASPDDSGEEQEESGFFALDMTRLKVASFDTMVLTTKEYYILYEIIDSISGEVNFETSDDVRFLTFEEDGRGCFWTDNEKGRPFNYEMSSAYSCKISFDDGGKASFGLYADQGGALPNSEEGSLWLALYLDGEALWFY